MKLSYSIVRDLAAFSTIGLVTVSWASTTESTIANLATLRLGFIAIIILYLVWGIVKNPSKAARILVGSAFMGLFAGYSILMLGVMSPTASSSFSLHMTWVILSSSIAGVYYLTPAGKPIVSDRAVWMFICFALLILIYTVVEGGLLISGYPRFVYEVKNYEGNTISYSQGISKFFGLAAVFSAIILSRSMTSSHLRYLCVGFVGVFLALSLIGGGRGDFIFALLTSMLVLRKFYLAAFFFVLVLIGFVYSSAVDETLSAYSVLVGRFAAFSYSLGMRDTLLIDSFKLLFDNINCFTIGCGIGYFQSYYHYPMALYPHNVVIEMLISFGLVTTAALVLLAVSGQKRVRERHGRSPNFEFMMVFFLLISVKSGTILTSFLLFGGLVFLALHGAASLQVSKREKAKISASTPRTNRSRPFDNRPRRSRF
ncbi:hypothetical protein [Erythrobacter aureus]|uniref:O-antigen ligase domain-containing protein n=1 Tax=Erythrobacter aureus TaxID=2182384 RepID=A0A345YFZ0_9SPHN|nr:hypothetical protein [Erythrobacter aureus]AXK42842.1 hypothetical protein DVR09_11345 [Erythrobacter aureus]